MGKSEASDIAESALIAMYFRKSIEALSNEGVLPERLADKIDFVVDMLNEYKNKESEYYALVKDMNHFSDFYFQMDSYIRFLEMVKSRDFEKNKESPLVKDALVLSGCFSKSLYSHLSRKLSELIERM
ncbi:MAG: hypothetical protein PHW96_00240 [Candidatus Nanoarchaeia archaeon]|nr:hypothetical protein [Candidatus Nanoarchaeia archaeon]